MNVQPYTYSCFGNFVKQINNHSKAAAIVYLFAITFFIASMSSGSFDTATKAIIGYSYLGAHVIMALLYIPFKKELEKQKTHQALVSSSQIKQTYDARRKELVGQITRANQQMKQLVDRTKDWPVLEAREKDVSDLIFHAHEVSQSCMKGTYTYPPIPELELSFYVIKFRQKNTPDTPVRVMTFSQRYLATDVPYNGEWYCLSDGDIVSFFGTLPYPFTAERLDDARFESLKKLLDNTHETHELAP